MRASISTPVEGKIEASPRYLPGVGSMASTAEAKVYTEWMQMKELIPQYLASLTEEERIGHEIAKEMLATSYSVERSRGFRAWYAKLQEAKKSGANQAQ